MNFQPPTTIETLERQSIELARGRADDGGVWAHSTDRSYVIFCVGQTEREIKRFMRFALETGLGFKPLRGCYKGKEERSFIVNLDDLQHITPFIADQESILLLHSYNRADVPRATLFEIKTKKCADLGYFTMGTAAVKDHYDAWTFDPMTGVYYVTEVQ